MSPISTFSFYLKRIFRFGWVADVFGQNLSGFRSFFYSFLFSASSPPRYEFTEFLLLLFDSRYFKDCYLDAYSYFKELLLTNFLFYI